jgi:hypothetical protein
MDGGGVYSGKQATQQNMLAFIAQPVCDDPEDVRSTIRIAAPDAASTADRLVASIELEGWAWPKTLDWSPDDQWLVFDQGDDETSALYMVDAEGGEPQRISSVGRNPAWRPVVAPEPTVTPEPTMTPAPTNTREPTATAQASPLPEPTTLPEIDTATEGNADLGFRPDHDGYSFANKTLTRTWEMFRQYYGVDQVEKPDGTRCRSAETFFNYGTEGVISSESEDSTKSEDLTNGYSNIAGGWSCVGFSYSSLLNYTRWEQPNAGRFAIKPVDVLFEETDTAAFDDAIAYYAGAQPATSQHLAAEYTNWKDTCKHEPGKIIDRIKLAIRNKEPVVINLKGIGFNENGKEIPVYHAIVPYGAEDISPSEVRVYVYENEAPGESRFISFTRAEDDNNWQWSYTFTGNLTGFNPPYPATCDDLYIVTLRAALEQGKPPVSFCEYAEGSEASLEDTPQAGGGMILVRVPTEGDWLIHDSEGRRIGKRNGDEFSVATHAPPLPSCSDVVSWSYEPCRA